MDDADELKAVMALLMQVSGAADNAPKLRQFISEQINLLRVDDDSLLAPYASSLLRLCKAGHKEAFGALKRCKDFFNATSQSLEEHLDTLLDAVGFEGLQSVIDQILELDPVRLVKALPGLVRQLEHAIVEHKLLILGILLAVALVTAAPFVPLLGAAGSACLASPQLHIALFKLLSVVGSHSDDVARMCLQLLAKAAKSELTNEPHIQSALLDAVNIVKDRCQFCNLFQDDTLQALAKCAVANPTAFKNIIAWNKGKAARIGDRNKYLVQAGASAAGIKRVANGSTAPTAGGFLLRFWGSASKDGKTKKSLVCPSPQSQSVQMAKEAQQGSSLHKESLSLLAAEPGDATTVTSSSVLPPTPLSLADQHLSEQYLLHNRPLMLSSPNASMRLGQLGVTPGIVAATNGSSAGAHESFSEFLARQQREKEQQGQGVGNTKSNWSSRSAQPVSSSSSAFIDREDRTKQQSLRYPSLSYDAMAAIDYSSAAAAGAGAGANSDNSIAYFDNGQSPYPSMPTLHLPPASTSQGATNSGTTLVPEEPEAAASTTVSAAEPASHLVPVKTKAGLFSLITGSSRGKGKGTSKSKIGRKKVGIASSAS